MICYRLGNDLNLDDVTDLYRASALGKRRPVDDRRRMAEMLRSANLVVTAWEGQLLVGVARSLTDHAYVTYLCDLVVRASHQRQGIGKELIRITQRAGGPQTRIAALSAPAVADYFPHIGFVQHDSAWTLEPGVVVR